MTLQELLNIQGQEAFLEQLTIEAVENYVSIDNKIAFPISISPSFERGNNIEIKYPNGVTIGEILFLKEKYVPDINLLPDEQKICFYTEYDQATIVDLDYTFHQDYLLLKKRNFKNYKKKFKTTSPIWGSFFHNDDKPTIEFNIKKQQDSLCVVDGINIDNDVYKNNLYLSIVEPNPFNRFLKLYHLLELQFDLHTAKEIKDLFNAGNREKEISSKLKEYSREEIKRLFSLIENRCSDLSSLVKVMNQVDPHNAKAIEIFYDFGRDSNPLKGKKFFTDILGRADKFGDDVFIESKSYNYIRVIPKTCAYWIYRVRSSIAHNKFGEYIMDENDEDFIVEFAEPLIKEVVNQCFKV